MMNSAPRSNFDTDMLTSWAQDGAHILRATQGMLTIMHRTAIAIAGTLFITVYIAAFLLRPESLPW